MSEPTHYEILGVDPSADYAAIKRAYRHLAKQCHPDTIANPTAEQQAQFARIASAYTELSNLDKRRAYDERLFRPQQQAASPGGPRFTRRHYSGYPYFQYDFITPFLHTFFVPRSGAPHSQKELTRAIFFNWRTFLVAVLGALYFFKFFVALDGTVVDKTMEAGWFQNVSYYAQLKNDAGEEKRRRIKSDLYEILKPGDRVAKAMFSFTVQINGETAQSVTVPRFLLQVGLIYLFISGTLFFIEYARK